MKKLLILFAHPALEKSRVNRRLIAGIENLEGVTLHDLYEEYPDFSIDVPREQAMLLEHDIIVMQHPFFWYSTPAMLKEWQDLVLQHGWAYGSEGKMLEGKRALNVLTTGGRESAYQPEGYNRFTMRQFLVPLEQTFRLCGVEYLPPFVVHGTLRMTPEEMQSHAKDYRQLIVALQDDRFNLDEISDHPRLNWQPDQTMRSDKEPD